MSLSENIVYCLTGAVIMLFNMYFGLGVIGMIVFVPVMAVFSFIST